jgi:hypothetical protein
MDTSRVNQGELVAGASGLLLFLFLFLDWAGGFNIWKQADVIDVVLAILALGAALLAVLPMAGQDVDLPAPRSRILVTIGIIATTIVLTILLEADELDFGIFLSTLAAIGIIVGGHLAESGRPAGALGGGGGRAAAPPPPAAPPTATQPPAGPGAGTPPAGPPGSEPPPRV